jgi:ATP-dependent helicase HrpB
MLTSLPIDAHLSLICDCVRNNAITIIEAPPGSGKTTRVAPALMQAGVSNDLRLYLLQPRRLAAKSVSQRIAWEQESRIGDRIGYQVRFDSQISRQTQLIVATEGILLRRLQDDPAISDTGVVLLDEFHERSLDADLLLGMLRRVQTAVRDDLRLVIMSATIESDSIRAKLGDVPIVRVGTQNFPVAIRYRQARPQQRLVDHMVEALKEIIPAHEGDILAFLPGAGEIQRCREALEHTSIGRECEIVNLYGAMQLEEQSRAIEVGSRRKIVLSTNIAETSLTIEGIRVVVDSGMARIMRFSPDVGLDRLSLESISQASATQRAGRAGRVAPGICYRLWSEASDRSRAAFLEPEIRRVDIVSAVLQLYAWGEGGSEDFPWLESPRRESIETAEKLLVRLGAIENGKITAVGKIMAGLPTHPRLARLVIAGYDAGCLERACWLAAMLSERDPFESRDNREGNRTGFMQTRAIHRWDSDCIERLIAIEDSLQGRNSRSPFGELNRGAVRSIANSAAQLRDQAAAALRMRATHRRDSERSMENDTLMRILLYGFPDRLAKRRSPEKPTGLMVGGKGVELSPQSGVTESELFLCIDIDSRPSDALVRQASRIELDWIPTEQLVDREELFFHPSQKQVVARRRLLWHDLVLSETPTSITDTVQCRSILLEAAIKHWEQAFPVDDERVGCLVARVNCLREWLPELDLPELTESVFHEIAGELCSSRRSLAELRTAPWYDWIQTRFSSQQWQAIEREAPTRIMVPSGSWIKIQYESGKAPMIAVKIQEMFSLPTTPRIAMGRIPILLHLLAPNMRPQQITNDLSSFWANGYPVVKKELKRRYPKHAWPDDPTTAPPGKR